MIKTLMTIMTHTSFMDKAITSTVKIFGYAEEGDISNVENEMQNRERLIAILQKLQEIVSINLNNLKAVEKKEAQEIVDVWSKDLSEWIATVSELDEEILKVLELQKEKTTQEISRVYKNHDKFKGYNLNKTK